MDWFTLILLSVFFVSISNILQRVLMRNEGSDAISYTIVFALFLTLFYSIPALFLGFKFPKFNLEILYFLISALLWGFGTIFLFKALKLIEASEVTLVSSLRIIVSIVGSIILLGESFDFKKALGTAIIFISVLLVTNIKANVKFNKGISFSLYTAFFYGSAIVVDAHLLKTYDVLSYLPIINFMIFAVLILLYPKTILRWKIFISSSFLKKLIPVVFFSCGQAYAYYFALQRGQLSQIVPINQAQVIVTVILAAIFLGESDHIFRKSIAAILVTIGVIFLK